MNVTGMLVVLLRLLVRGGTLGFQDRKLIFLPIPLSLNVISLKMIYDPDIFSNLAQMTAIYRTLKNCNEKMGSLCLFLPCVPVIL